MSLSSLYMCGPARLSSPQSIYVGGCRALQQPPYSVANQGYGKGKQSLAAMRLWYAEQQRQQQQQAAALLAAARSECDSAADASDVCSIDDAKAEVARLRAVLHQHERAVQRELEAERLRQLQAYLKSPEHSEVRVVPYCAVLCCVVLYFAVSHLSFD